MAKIEIVNSLFEEIKKKFKGESHEVIDLLESLEENPHKGKLLGSVGGIVIKDDPDTFGSIEIKKPVFHKMALDIVRSAREKYCVAV